MRRDTMLAIAILGLASVVVAWVALPVFEHRALTDDSFITLTYARNLAAGNGFVYNHPPPSLGTTTPLFALLTAGLAAALPFAGVVGAAIAASLACWVATGWVLWGLLRRAGFDPLPAALAAALVLLTPQGWVPYLGMEMWTFQLLLVSSALLVLAGRALPAGLCVGLLALTRGEGVLLGALLLPLLWRRERRLASVFALAAGGVLALWCAYGLLTFGSVLPSTLAAKQAQAELPVGGSFVEGIVLGALPDHVAGFGLLGSALLNPLLALVAIGLYAVSVRYRALAVLPLWCVGYLAGYAVLDPQPYSWYALHAVFVLQCLAGIGLAALAQWPAAAARAAAGALGAALLAVDVPAIAAARASPGDARAPHYRAIAAWLAEHTRPEQSVAFIEIGYLGFYTGNRIVDLAGLLDPEIAARVASEGLDGFEWGFFHYRPDYYVYAPEFDWALEGVNDALPGSYEPVHRVPRPGFRGPAVIFRRREGGAAGPSPAAR